jgi:NAD(P)-dependent dehydrogenase (short-subunit alcohol dehydrogenase family)
MRLANQRAVLTGARAGVGREMAIAFAREGARVLLFDVEPADELAAQLTSAGCNATAVQGSVAERSDVDRLFRVADELFGGLDILVNNAGVSGNMPSLQITDEFWNRTLAVNLTGPFWCARAAGERMVAQRSGVILNIASMYGVVAAPERLAYCASKSALCMLTKTLAIEWGPHGVRVNALAPGYINTNMTEDLVKQGKLDLDRLRARTPLRRLAEPAEIAELAVFACSPAAQYVTGQIIGIDGGWTAYGYL